MPVPTSSAYLIEYVDCLYVYGLVLSCDAATAQHLVLETYRRAKAYAYLPDGSGEVKTWLIRTLRSLWTGRSVHPRDVPACMEILSMSGRTAIEVPRAEIVNAIQQLPEHLRELIVLRELEGLSYAVIADIVNRPREALVSGLREAREALKGKWANSF